MKTLLAAALFAISAVAQAATPSAYDAALDRYYELTVRKQLDALDMDAMVAKFREAASSRADAKSCPALKTALDEFADKNFRTALQGWLRSPALEAQIKKGFAKHLEQADLDAWLAFAETPAGMRFVEREARASAAMEETLRNTEQLLMESPEMKTMLGDMVVKLMPVMMQCQK